MKKYYIYHIEGIKIGCTDNLKRRMKAQSCIQYTILETYDDIFTASIRERELQKEYGYKVDTKPYWKTIKMTSKGGLTKGCKNHSSEYMASIGKLGGIKNVESGHISKLSSKNITSGLLARLSELKKIPIIQFDKVGNMIQEFSSAAEAANILKLHSQNITACCKGKVKTAGGYTFNYKN